MNAAPPSLVRAALMARCPRCGQGPVFRGVLTLRPACPFCGLDFAQSDIGDATAVPVIMVLGALLVSLAFWVEFRFSPPLWVHVVLWPVLAVPLAILMMRPLKAGFLALQFRTRSREMGV